MERNIMIIRVRGANFKVNATPFYQGFWNKFPNWETETFRIFQRFLSNKHSYLDIGAWIGPTVLYGAQIAKHVYALEPDPVAYKELINNIKINPGFVSKITCIKAAMEEKPGLIKLFKRSELGDSSSSVIPTRSEKDYCTVRATSIEELTKNYNMKDINFIKMDIEGGEYFIIPSITKYLQKNRPTLLLSLHPPFLQEAIQLRSKTNNNSRIDLKSLNKEMLTRNLLKHLDFYKYIYDYRGNLVTKDSVLKLNQHGMFLFTDEQW
ncbi:FkbM family methyltransferase [Cytobacillus oceanisediminis]|uniref:FkbM family methyltransferase n=1 Tax=Cytobacillus oceanisediminis TaxID=665099 RepID=A0A2V3A752_9BACI|nr:FkbM family methyltransferase [Cytobacillus oceanisediminis]PWW31910.1 FkbM family methyltransferase [Cytobacillus oceanisediminis]